MRFNIVGLEDSYGKHRFSNNTILKALQESSSKSDSMLFVWWVEKIFLDPNYSDIVERLCKTEWFGVMHVPLMTPNWAMYSQNNLAKIYFSKTWRKALNTCKGIITLSEHMKFQLDAIYPDLNIHSLLHPVGISDADFNYESYCHDPNILLVGTWLRDFDGFVNLKINVRKKVLLNHYTEGFLKDWYDKYHSGILKEVKELDYIKFVPNDEYDRLICSSVVFIGLHETSANNALCECIAYSIPFITKKHPAIVEYCGDDYPLYVNDFNDFQLTNDKVLQAHIYLKNNKNLRDKLSMERFVLGVQQVYDSF